MTMALKATDLYYQAVLEELSFFRDYSNKPVDLIAYCRDSQGQAEKVLAAAYSSTSGMQEEVF